MDRYTLFGRRNSGSFAVQVALEEISAPYDQIWIGESAEDLATLRAVTPTGKVPALRLPQGPVMFESAAMLIHLALAHPQAGLAPPPGSVAHAAFLQWLTFMSANVYDAVLRAYYPARFSSRGEADAAVVGEQATRDLGAQLALIAGELQPYVLGPSYSIADVYLHMLAAWYPGGRERLQDTLPALAAHAALMSARPAVAKVEGEHAG